VLTALGRNQRNQPQTFDQKESEMATKFTPLYDRILVRRVDEADTTRGGIIIPDTAKEKKTEAEVISVGTGRVTDKGDLRPLVVKVGDHVLMGKYAGNEIEIDGEDFVIVREEEVLGILTPSGSGAKKDKERETAGSRR
jgi:chaperonin GroES